MAESVFTTPIPDFPDVVRPLHQYKWSIWEEKKELRQPQEIGHMKFKQGGREYVVVKNGSANLARGEYAAPVITTLAITNLPEATEMLSGKIDIDIPGSNSTAITEDMFKDGTIYVSDGTGVGLALPIQSNPALAASTAATITITLDTELFVELDTTTDVKLVTSPFRNIAQGGTASGFGGLPPDAVTGDRYFWLQRRGPAVAKADADVNAGAALTPAGSGELVTAAAGDPVVAYALESADVSVSPYFAVYLIG